MYDIRNLNIWKQEEKKDRNLRELRDLELSDINLSVRSYNCLKRANCNTVGDILDLMDEEGNGLRSIRNLGSRSETEIKEILEELKKEYHARRAVRSDAEAGEAGKENDGAADRRFSSVAGRMRTVQGFRHPLCEGLMCGPAAGRPGVGRGERAV